MNRNKLSKAGAILFEGLLASFIAAIYAAFAVIGAAAVASWMGFVGFPFGTLIWAGPAAVAALCFAVYATYLRILELRHCIRIVVVQGVKVEKLPRNWAEDLEFEVEYLNGKRMFLPVTS